MTELILRLLQIHADPEKTLKIPGNLVCDPDVYSRRVGKYVFVIDCRLD